MSTELLVKACDTVHQNEVKDLRGCYKKGYVVVVKPTGHKWGKEGLNRNKFYIIRAQLGHFGITSKIELDSWVTK